MKPDFDAVKPTVTVHSLPLNACLYSGFLCILFGANATAIKISLTGFGPYTAAALRFSIASVTLVLWARMTGRPLALSRSQIRKISWLCLLFPIQLSLFYHGLGRTTATHGTLIANLLPFFILILAHVFIPGERITLRKFIGIGFGFGGVLFLLGDLGGIGSTLHKGDLIVLGAVTLWSINAIYIKRIIDDFHPVQVTVFPMIISVPVFFACSWLWDPPMAHPLEQPVVLAMLYQSLVTASFGFVAWNTLVSRFGTSAVHSFIFIMPVSGVFFGVVLLDEPLTLNLILAIALIVTGILTVHVHLPGLRRPPVQ